MEKQVVFLITVLGAILVSVVPLAGQDIVVDFDDLGASSNVGSKIPENYISMDPITGEPIPGIIWYGYSGYPGYVYFMSESIYPDYSVPHSGDNYIYNKGYEDDTIGFAFDASAGFDNVLLVGGWFALVSQYPTEKVRFAGYEDINQVTPVAVTDWMTLTDEMTFLHAINVATGKYFGFMGYIEVEFDPATPTSHKFALDDVTFQRQPAADAGLDQMVHPGDTVALNGGNSSDPDGDYPLSYEWDIVSAPTGSVAELEDWDTVTPTFTPDQMGDYVIQLVVTDSRGGPSQPDTVTISTSNTPPIASAGDDIALSEIGEIVQLNGSQSYDDEGDEFSYLWTILAKPEGSVAELDDATVVDPMFVVDVYGEYVIELIVTDEFGAVSEPDTVLAGFFNVKPVADAGGNQSVAVGETVTLDGSGSYDQNLDELSYHWSIVSKPAGSQATLDDPEAITPRFVADVVGTYVVSLVVNDGIEDSEPANVSIEAVTSEEAAILALMEAVEAINALDPASFQNPFQAQFLTFKVNVVIRLVDRSRYWIALLILQFDIIRDMDGCVETGEPDQDDWIRNCEAQGQVYPLIEEAIEHVWSAIDL
jgi:K319L-like, PKD domain